MGDPTSSACFRNNFNLHMNHTHLQMLPDGSEHEHTPHPGQPSTLTDWSASRTQSRTSVNSRWSFPLRSRSSDSQKSRWMSPGGPRGRVAATASLATWRPLRQYSCSGVLLKNVLPAHHRRDSCVTLLIQVPEELHCPYLFPRNLISNLAWLLLQHNFTGTLPAGQ